MFFDQRITRLIPLSVIMAGIFLISHQPGDSFTLPKFWQADKLLHCIAYGGLGLAAMLSLSPKMRRTRSVASAVGVVVFCMVYGISDEFHQSFIPGRVAGFFDVVADTVGGIGAVLCWYIFIERNVKHRALSRKL